MSSASSPTLLPSTIAILGATLESWLAAALLVQRLRPLGIRIVVVPTADDVSPPIAVTASPAIGLLHRQLKLDERDIVRSCNGSFRLATQFKGFGGDDKAFASGFAATGEPRQGASFHHYWRRAHDWDGARSFSSYNLAAAAAAKGKFAPPMPGAMDVRGRFEFGLHLDGALYQDYLKKCALHYGVTLAPASLGSMVRDHDGTVTALKLDSSEILDCSFVVNASGHATEETENDDRQNTKSGPGHITWQKKEAVPNLSLTRVEAQKGGYDFHIPLYGQTITGTYREGSADNAIAVTGSWRLRPWTENILAIGRGAADLEPLHFPLLPLTGTAIDTFCELLPFGNDTPFAREEFNRRMAETVARFVEYQELHHLLTTGIGENSDLSGTIQRKLIQFRSRGRIVTYDHESFDEDSHLALYLGAGLIPDRYDALAGLASDTQVKEFLSATLKMVRTARDEMPDQREWLEKSGIARQVQGTA